MYKHHNEISSLHCFSIFCSVAVVLLNNVALIVVRDDIFCILRIKTMLLQK